MKKFKTYIILITLCVIISGCSTVDTGISGMWAEDDNSRFIILSPNGEFHLGSNNTIGFTDSYSIAEDGNIQLTVPDVMYSKFYKVKLSKDATVLIIESIDGEQIKLYRLKIQK